MTTHKITLSQLESLLMKAADILRGLPLLPMKVPNDMNLNIHRIDAR